jgi:hypothetical protein
MSAMLLDPVREASAWTGPDLAQDQSWVHRLDGAEVSEVKAALAAVKARGLVAGAFGRDDFRLPNLGPYLDGILDRLEDGRGVALLRGLPVADLDIDDVRRLYWGIGSYLGDGVSQNPEGELISDITDLGYDYSERTVRGYTTAAELLPHCDPVSDLVVLLCVHPASHGGYSCVASSTTIYNHILAEHPEALDVLYRGFQYDLRGQGVTGDDTELTQNRIPVYSYFGGRLSCNFNANLMGNRVKTETIVPLTTEEDAAVESMMAAATDPAVRFDTRLETGDLLALNNRTMLHWRTAFEDAGPAEQNRLLMRLWLNMPAGRDLAPEFADHYNTGARAGVAVRRDGDR